MRVPGLLPGGGGAHGWRQRPMQFDDFAALLCVAATHVPLADSAAIAPSTAGSAAAMLLYEQQIARLTAELSEAKEQHAERCEQHQAHLQLVLCQQERLRTAADEHE